MACAVCYWRDCTPEGLQFEPAAVGDGVGTFVCDCTACHPDIPLAERLAAERERVRLSIAHSDGTESSAEWDVTPEDLARVRRCRDHQRAAWDRS